MHCGVIMDAGTAQFKETTRFTTDVCIDYVYIKGPFHDEVNSVFALLKCKFCSVQYAKFQRHRIAIRVDTKAMTNIVDIII